MSLNSLPLSTPSGPRSTHYSVAPQDWLLTLQFHPVPKWSPSAGKALGLLPQRRRRALAVISPGGAEGAKVIKAEMVKPLRTSAGKCRNAGVFFPIVEMNPNLISSP